MIRDLLDRKDEGETERERCQEGGFHWTACYTPAWVCVCVCVWVFGKATGRLKDKHQGQLVEWWMCGESQQRAEPSKREEMKA